MRDRLKEAKDIGTPATRAEIIKGLKRQNLLATERKLIRSAFTNFSSEGFGPKLAGVSIEPRR